MKAIQPLFILAIFLLFFFYLIFWRSSLTDRVIGILVFTSSLVAVLFPDLTSDLAHLLGVGRGTDLCVYLFFIASAFGSILFYSKLARLERINTKIIRYMAIEHAELMEETDDSKQFEH